MQITLEILKSGSTGFILKLGDSANLGINNEQ